MDKKAAQALLGRLDTLTAFSFTLSTEPGQSLRGLLACCCREDLRPEDFVAAYCRVYQAFLQVAAEGQDGFAGALLAQVAYTPSPFARLLIRLPGDQLPYSLVRAGSQDLAALGALAALEPAFFLALAARQGVPQDRTESLPAWEATVPGARADARLSPEILSDRGLPLLSAFYRTHGTGLFARYDGLCYVGEDAAPEGGLAGVEAPDPTQLEDLMRYEAQRRMLIENTEHLLSGRSGAANILLYGDKGCGKSATVKALLGAYAGRGLRIVEVPPAQLCHLPRLFARLRELPNKCIVFVDDLAFSDSCPEYTALKTVLEGGLEARPDNVVVYATSNRQNIVRQRFSERSDDVSERDTLEEKFSLADRFDLRLTFHAPTQEEYLQIVRGMLEKQGNRAALADPDLREAALRWSVRRASTSPRTARQFVDALGRGEALGQ